MSLSLTEWQERLLDGLEAADTVGGVVDAVASALAATNFVRDVHTTVLAAPSSTPPDGLVAIGARAMRLGQTVHWEDSELALLMSAEGKTFGLVWADAVGDRATLEPALSVLVRAATQSVSRVLDASRRRAMATEMAALHQVMEGVAAATTTAEVAETVLVVCATSFGWDAGAVLRRRTDQPPADGPVPGHEVLASFQLDDDRLEGLRAVAHGGQGLRGGFVGETLPGPTSGALVWPLHAPTDTVLVLQSTKDVKGHTDVAATLAPIAQLASVARAGLDRVDRIAREQVAIEAERASRAKSEFLSRMSHELRTPLNAVLGFAQLLELDDLGPDSMESLAQIKRAGAHLLDLVNEVLDISRIEAGRITLSLEPLDLAEMVAESVSLLRPMAEDRRIELVVEREGVSGTWLRGDRQRVKQILLNLVSNGVKYNRRGGTVTVKAGETGDGMISISVADTGRGIKPADVARLFTPFERLDADDSAVEGTGLGLALSKGLADLMGGGLEATSVVGEGTEFLLTLPGATPVDGVEPIVLDNSPSTTGRVEGTVLYIEDNLPNVKLVQRILRRRPAVRVEHATRGLAGLDAARSDPPDLVLLDLDLPDMSGVDVLGALRTHPVTASVPVVVISADATSQQSKTLLDAGAVAYLAKPFDLTQFLELVDSVLTESGDGKYDGAREGGPPPP